jgi:hypothetical protein
VVTVHSTSRFTATIAAAAAATTATATGVIIHFAFQMGLIDGNVAY